LPAVTCLERRRAVPPRKQKTLSQAVELNEREQGEAEERKHPRAQVLYEAIRLEGEHELKRPFDALAWSGLAAGLSMGFSFVAMGLLHALLPHAGWSKLLVALGYSVGFLIVIVGRQQLFTENSLTPIIPLLQAPSGATLFKVCRLWAIVLVSNLLGTLVFAFALQQTRVFDSAAADAFAELGRQAMVGGFWRHFVRAIFAGWLIALMTWMLAGADARAFIVVVMTYLVGVGQLSHVIAGSCEAFFAVFNGDATFWDYLGQFLAPAAFGNMLGGVALVTLLSHAQVAADESSE
jgi:formate/nitrite transporter FocA (FNT family)